MLNLDTKAKVSAELNEVNKVLAIVQSQKPTIRDEKYEAMYRDSEKQDHAFKSYEDDCKAHTAKEGKLIAYSNVLEAQLVSFEAKAIMDDVRAQTP